MIKEVDIKKFGCFQDFVWRDNVRDSGNGPVSFGRLNILYGQNYSGKTTLSRIFRAFQEQELPVGVVDADFKISIDEGSISQNDIGSSEVDFRVYNSDFVNSNLSVLRDHETGDVVPFAILGQRNVAIEAEISGLEEQLGDAGASSGLFGKLFSQEEKLVALRRQLESDRDQLDSQLREKANQDIKRDRIYGDPSYNIARIKSDIATAKRKSIQPLSTEQKAELEEIIRQAPFKEEVPPIDYTPAGKILFEGALSVLRREVRPTEELDRLVGDQLLQVWVREGVELHRGKRDSCGFCGQRLPDKLWDELRKHFNEASMALEQDLALQLGALQQEFLLIDQVMVPQSQRIYPGLRDRFASLESKLEDALGEYEAQLEGVVGALRQKSENLFSSKVEIPVVPDSDPVSSVIDAMNDLIRESNERAKALASEQVKARSQMRLSVVVEFLKDIQYEAASDKINKLEEQIKSQEAIVGNQREEIGRLESRLQQLRLEQRDERKGAEQVNQYLSHFFGHQALKLEAVRGRDGAGFRFKITRNGSDATNLSEGECSLIAFCYFLARLKDVDTQDKDLIIYIDDPISSLDNNHIFFVFSLIEAELASWASNEQDPNNIRYRQLFISTHNLDFLKYLKKLSKPPRNQGGYEMFLVERGANTSVLRWMPKYLRDYVTEFNYLFDEIYKCQDPDNAETHSGSFYSFGNNLRKFLESYLYFKYPAGFGRNSHDKRLRKFFGDDGASVALAVRVSNELSHLEEIFDRGVRPIDVPEISRLATFVLNKIREKDPDQYSCLLQSIGKDPE